MQPRRACKLTLPSDFHYDKAVEVPTVQEFLRSFRLEKSKWNVLMEATLCYGIHCLSTNYTLQSLRVEDVETLTRNVLKAPRSYAVRKPKRIAVQRDTSLERRTKPPSSWRVGTKSMAEGKNNAEKIESENDNDNEQLLTKTHDMLGKSVLGWYEKILGKDLVEKAWKYFVSIGYPSKNPTRKAVETAYKLLNNDIQSAVTREKGRSPPHSSEPHDTETKESSPTVSFVNFLQGFLHNQVFNQSQEETSTSKEVNNENPSDTDCDDTSSVSSSSDDSSYCGCRRSRRCISRSRRRKKVQNKADELDCCRTRHSRGRKPTSHSHSKRLARSHSESRRRSHQHQQQKKNKSIPVTAGLEKLDASMRTCTQKKDPVLLIRKTKQQYLREALAKTKLRRFDQHAQEKASAGASSSVFRNGDNSTAKWSSKHYPKTPLRRTTTTTGRRSRNKSGLKPHGPNYPVSIYDEHPTSSALEIAEMYSKGPLMDQFMGKLGQRNETNSLNRTTDEEHEDSELPSLLDGLQNVELYGNLPESWNIKRPVSNGSGTGQRTAVRAKQPSPRTKAGYSGWMGDYGPIHTRTIKPSTWDDGEYQDGEDTNTGSSFPSKDTRQNRFEWDFDEIERAAEAEADRARGRTTDREEAHWKSPAAQLVEDELELFDADEWKDDEDDVDVRSRSNDSSRSDVGQTRESDPAFEWLSTNS